MQTRNKNENNDDCGSIGIGAMIVFIALILVAAVASAVIIQTGEKLQQNAQQSGSDTQQEISGKISIITVWIGPQTVNAEEITMVFETSPGSEPIQAANVHWTVICETTAAATTPAVHSDDFTAATQLDTTAIPQGILDPGTAYMIDLEIGDAAATSSCAPNLNDEDRLIITVDGGGTTYENLYYSSVQQGDVVV